MKFCSKCGKEITDEAVVCIHCGCSASNEPAANNAQEESGTMAIIAFVCAFFIPIVSLVIGIIAIKKYKSTTYKNLSIAATIISALFILIPCAIFSSLFLSFL